MATEHSLNDELDGRPKTKRFSAGSLLLIVLLFRVLNSLHWTFVGGLGWGAGTVLQEVVGGPIYGGAIGFAITMSFLFCLSDGSRETYGLWVIFSAVGGAAFGAFVGMSLLGEPFGVVIGAVLGLFLGCMASIMRQDHFNVNPIVACLTGIIGAAWLVLIPTLVPGIAGWVIAGGISLFNMRLFSVLLRRDPVFEIDENDQPVREVPTGECCWRIVRESWWPTSPLAWAWNGAFAALFIVWGAKLAVSGTHQKDRYFILVLAAVVAFVSGVWHRIKKPPQDDDKSKGSKEGQK